MASWSSSKTADGPMCPAALSPHDQNETRHPPRGEALRTRPIPIGGRSCAAPHYRQSIWRCMKTPQKKARRLNQAFKFPLARNQPSPPREALIVNTIIAKKQTARKKSGGTSRLVLQFSMNGKTLCQAQYQLTPDTRFIEIPLPISRILSGS